MCTNPVSRSMSDHRRAQTSPRLPPVVAAKASNTPCAGSLAAAAAIMARSSAGVGGAAFVRRSVGGVALFAGLVSNHPHRTAWPSAALIMSW